MVKEKINCAFCGTSIEDYRSRKRKFCNYNCLNRYRYNNCLKIKKCKYCEKEFEGLANKVMCSQACSSNERADHLKKIHLAKRKYPKIEGLNRCQIFRKFNPDKGREELHRDNLKRGILILFLGGQCCKCGYSEDLRALQLDHIHGDGKEDRKRVGNKISRYYLKNLEEAKNKIQVLCSNCHSIKTHASNEYTALEYRRMLKYV